MKKPNPKKYRNTENLKNLENSIPILTQYSFSLQNQRSPLNIIKKNMYLIRSHFLQNQNIQNMSNDSYIKVIKINQQSKKNEIIDEHQKILIQQNFNYLYKKIIFSKTISFQKFIQFLYKIHKDLQYTSILKSPSIDFIESKYQYLDPPKIKRKKILFLELNQTLIYSKQGYFAEFTHQFTLKTSSNNDIISYNIRPDCSQFLNKMEKHFQIYIFTTSCYQYATNIIKQLNLTQNYISGLLTKESCMETKKGYLIKNLKILKNFDLKNMILIDSNVYSFALHLDNGIPIFPYDGNNQDKQLKQMINFLIQVSKYQDVRIPINQRFNLKGLANTQIKDLIRRSKKNYF